jgi:hypothetical protein
MNRHERWLFRRYRNFPATVRRVLASERLGNDLRELAKLRRRYPKVCSIPHQMANVLMRAGREGEALRVWTQTVRQFPGAASPYFQRGHWAIERRRFHEAEKFLRLCLRRDRGYFGETARFWRAECFIRLGRFERALAELEHVNDGYQEWYFLDYKSRSKSDMLNEIRTKSGE